MGEWWEVNECCLPVITRRSSSPNTRVPGKLKSQTNPRLVKHRLKCFRFTETYTVHRGFSSIHFARGRWNAETFFLSPKSFYQTVSTKIAVFSTTRKDVGTKFPYVESVRIITVNNF